MKIKSLLLLMAIMLLPVIENAQTLKCFTPDSSSSQAQSSCAQENICLIGDYIPGQYHNVIYVRLNFWYLMPSQNAGKFAYVTSNDADSITAWMNKIYDSLASPKLKVYPTPPYIKKTKIQFIRNDFNKAVDPTLYSMNDYTAFDPTYYTPYISSSNAVDIVYKTATDTTQIGFACTNGIPAKSLKVVHDTNTANPYSASVFEAYLLGHELGHVMGLYHTDNQFPVHPLQIANDTCYYPDYKIEDSSTFGVSAIPNCDNPADTVHSNNIMGNNNCNKYLSPVQIGICRFNLLNNPSLKGCVTNLSSHYIPPTPCDTTNSSYDIVISSNTTWNNTKNIRGNVIVSTGYDLIVNCDQNFPAEGKIIIEPGARAIFNGVTLRSACPNNPWYGIEVWGNSSASQDSTNQGVLHISNSTIKNAKVGVTVAKRNSNNSIDYTKTGGIARIYGGAFVGNKRDFEVYPYYIATSYNNNFYSFQPAVSKCKLVECSFMGDGNSVEQKDFCIWAEGVYSLTIAQCDFNLDPNGNATYSGSNGTAVAIRAFFSNIRIIGGFNYNIKNYLHGVVAHNANGEYPIVIDGMRFSNIKSNAIVINNSTGSRITNNKFYSTDQNISYDPSTGVYLFECNNYKVENNQYFGSGTTSANQVGILIRNSGPYVNNVYNNTFNYLNQGIFAIGYNWNENDGTGLKINCNDFTNVNYNVGVMDLPYYQYGTDWTGIQKVQGKENLGTFDNVRNKYGVPGGGCNAGYENKYHLTAYNNSAAHYFSITRHGTFQDTIFHPTPQTYNSCSDLTEVVNIPGQPAPGSKSLYCPNNATPLMSKSQLYTEILFLNDTISLLMDSISVFIDKGNSQHMIDLVFDEYLSAENLKDSLLAAGACLSDTVLRAYYTKPDVPSNYIKQIHDINAPVAPIVWQDILNLGLGDGLMDTLANMQARTYLSPSNELSTSLTFFKGKLQDCYFEKFDRFLNDSVEHSIDSVIVFLKEGVIPNSDLYLVDAYHSLGDRDSMYTYLYNLYYKGGFYEDLVNLKMIYWGLEDYPAGMESLKVDETTQAQVYALAYSGSYIVEGIARGLLSYIWGIELQAEKPVPFSEGGLRAQNPITKSKQTTKAFSSNIKLFPNPANNQLIIELENNDVNNCIVSGVDGKIYAKIDIKEMHSIIDLTHFNNGVYFVSFFHGKQIISTKKVVVMK
ncbi:MAG: T9SS type A sorting domain-containing protein [Bacteroidia bacterium]